MNPSKPRILQLCLTLDTGGLERVVVNLANELSNSAQAESFICSVGRTTGTVIPSTIAPEVKWTELKGKPWFTPWNALKLASVVRKNRIDLIHAHGTQPLVYALTSSVLCGVPVVATKHNSYEDLDFFTRWRSFNWLAQKRVSSFIGVSEQATQMCQRVFSQSADRCSTLINGTELYAKNPRPKRGAPNAENKFIIATVCRLAPEKDLVTLLNAFAQVRRECPHTELWIIGDGPERAGLTQLSELLGLKDSIRFWGFRGKVEQILNCVDLYVNSSWTEGISISILEAMSVGLPVVATAVGGTPIIVNDKQNGLLVPPRSPADFAAAMLHIIRHPDQCAQMGAASWKSIEDNWSLQRMAERYLQLYRRALGVSAPAPSTLPRPSVVQRLEA